VVLEAVGEDVVGAVVGVAEHGGLVAVEGVLDLAGQDAERFLGLGVDVGPGVGEGFPRGGFLCLCGLWWDGDGEW